MATVTVNGLDELAHALDNLPQVIAKRYLRRAMVAGLSLIKDEAQQRCPVLQIPDDRRIAGALRDAIIIFRDRSPENMTEKYYVTIRKIKLTRAQKKVIRILNRGGKTLGILEDAFYGRFPEFGTSKMAAQPFMRPAFESQKENAVAAFSDSLRASLPAIVEESKS